MKRGRTVCLVWSQFYKNKTNPFCVCIIYRYVAKMTGKLAKSQQWFFCVFLLNHWMAGPWVISVFFSMFYSLNFSTINLYITYFFTFLIWNISYLGKNICDKNMIHSLFRIIKQIVLYSPFNRRNRTLLRLPKCSVYPLPCLPVHSMFFILVLPQMFVSLNGLLFQFKISLNFI